MLIFPDEWRFRSQGKVPDAVQRQLESLIPLIALPSNPREVYETFKSNFAASLGESAVRSSSRSWAESDMAEYMDRASINEPLYLQAFYDSVEQMRAAGIPVPTVEHLNELLAECGCQYRFAPPKLIQITEAQIIGSGESTPTPAVAHASLLASPAEHASVTADRKARLPAGQPSTFDRPTCFVVQPFDKGPFDRRFAEIFSPAIYAAGLQPYRVDQDASADIPIEAIEEGIRSAVVCLADISSDNPNVWYELGFAYASGVPVVMVCSERREGKKYPFDIQHKNVLSYGSESPSDFRALSEGITARLLASMRKGATIRQLADTSQVVAPVSGLSQPEMSVLAVLAGSIAEPGDTYRLWNLRQDCERAQVTALGVTLALKKLASKGFIRIDQEEESYGGGTYQAVGLNDAGWFWIEANEDKFTLLKTPAIEISDADIPF